MKAGRCFEVSKLENPLVSLLFHKSSLPWKGTGMQANPGRRPKAGFVKSPITALWEGTSRDRNAISFKYPSAQTLFAKQAISYHMFKAGINKWAAPESFPTCHKRLMAKYGRRGVSTWTSSL